jgi:hypothetical protein
MIGLALILPDRVVYLTLRPPPHGVERGRTPPIKSPLRVWRGDLGVR